MNYANQVQKVIKFLKMKGICSGSLTSHVECYKVFGEYLNLNGMNYSSNTATQWLTSIKNKYTRQKCYFWSQYMKQLSEMIYTGSISNININQIKPMYEKVPDILKSRQDEYLESRKTKYTRCSWEKAKKNSSKVMLYFADLGRGDISEITYEDIIGLISADFSCTDKTKSILIGHAIRMMTFFAEKGLCRRGYSMLLNRQTYPYVGFIADFSNNHQSIIEQHRIRSLDFPTDAFYNSIDGFINTLIKHEYVGTTLYLARHSLTALYIFLEIHKLGFIPEIAWIWFIEIKNIIGGSWKHWRRILKCYEEYADTGDITPEIKYRYEPSILETLPGWCREPITAFLNQKQKESRSIRTIYSSQYPCVRFCKHLISCGITDFFDITHAVINEFSRTDQHSTFQGRSGYFTVIRQFLEYLEGRGLIHNKSLHKVLSAGTAPVEKIVDILADEQICKINHYRQSHSLPIELRNTAMVIIGLRLGLRASDVVNLKLCDIDWKKRQVTIIQQKTQAQITLPLLVDVGNAIYTYIKNGRPKSHDVHVFIRHKAPYCKLTIKNCTKALHAILPERKAVIGGGFHVTRRTFATRLLKNNSSIGTVMDSLGHHDNTSVMKYLSLDEERIQSCALSLSDTGLTLSIGGLQ